MARIGDRKLIIPQDVNIVITNQTVNVNGPKGQLEQQFNNLIAIKQIENEVVTVNPKPHDHKYKAMHGTVNSIIENMIIGVTKGYSKELEIRGVGYRCQLDNNNLKLALGFSHPVLVSIPSNLQIEVPIPTEIKISGIDKQFVSQFAATILKIRKVEPYGGKGIRYKGQIIKQKAGKTASKKK